MIDVIRQASVSATSRRLGNSHTDRQTAKQSRFLILSEYHLPVAEFLSLHLVHGLSRRFGIVNLDTGKNGDKIASVRRRGCRCYGRFPLNLDAFHKWKIACEFGPPSRPTRYFPTKMRCCCCSFANKAIEAEEMECLEGDIECFVRFFLAAEEKEEEDAY